MATAALLFASVALCSAHGSSTLNHGRPTRIHASNFLALRGGELAPSVPMIESEMDLEAVLEEAGSALVVVDFYAEWCGPCKKLAPTLEDLAQKTPAAKVQFFKVDVDNARELAAAQGVKSMPTLQFFRNGKKVHQIVGGDINALKQEVAKETVSPLLRALKLDALIATLVSQPKQSAMLLAVIGYLVAPWQKILPALA